MPQAVEDRRQTQHLAVSAWGVPQCGQRHIGMARMVAAIGSPVDPWLPGWLLPDADRRLVRGSSEFVGLHQDAGGPDPRVAPLGIIVSKIARPFASVVLFPVTVGMPGMLSVKVTRAPASGLPSGSSTMTVRRMGSGSSLCLIEYLDALSEARSRPDPRVTTSSASATLPAGSVAVILSGLRPVVIGRVSANEPSFAAVPDTESPVSWLRTINVVRPCVRPSIVTALRLMTAPSLGASQPDRRLVRSRIQRTSGDDSDSPPGPTIVTLKSLVPFVRVTGMIVRWPAASGASWIGVGAWSFSAR